jgi:hypothetical protein
MCASAASATSRGKLVHSTAQSRKVDLRSCMVRLDSSESFKNKLTPVTFPPGRFKRDNVANGRGGRLAVSPIFAPSRHRQTARSQSRNWNTRPAAASTGAALSGRPCQEQIWGDRMRGDSSHSRNRLSTRSVWRPTGADGAGFAGARSPVPNSHSASRARRDCQKTSEIDKWP